MFSPPEDSLSLPRSSSLSRPMAEAVSAQTPSLSEVLFFSKLCISLSLLDLIQFENERKLDSFIYSLHKKRIDFYLKKKKILIWNKNLTIDFYMEAISFGE